MKGELNQWKGLSREIDEYFKAFVEWRRYTYRSYHYPTLYRYAEKITSDLHYLNRKEIHKIIKEIEHICKNYKDVRYPGIFISCLINERYPGEEIEIEVGYPFDLLGMFNTKNLIIEGDVGSYLGIGMKENEIVVKGDAKDNVGHGMEDGKITVEGNVRNDAGCVKKGGIIVIKGDAGDNVGNKMEGGTIYLWGDYKSISSNIRGGEIYHKGKLIYKDGKRIW